MKDKKYLFEKMPVGKALATLAIPTILSQLITMVYNLADTYFIGKTNDPYKIAAVSVVFVLYFVMNALSNLFGIGGGSLISRLLGSGQTENARSVCAFSFYGSLVITAVYSLVCFFFMKPILLLIGAGSNTLGFASDYVLWVICRTYCVASATQGMPLSDLHSELSLTLYSIRYLCSGYLLRETR